MLRTLFMLLNPHHIEPSVPSHWYKQLEIVHDWKMHGNPRKLVLFTVPSAGTPVMNLKGGGILLTVNVLIALLCGQAQAQSTGIYIYEFEQLFHIITYSSSSPSAC